MSRRYRKSPKMELYRRHRAPDYTELAYREAVAKLRYLLAESYTPVSVHKPSTSSLQVPEKEGAAETSVYPVEARSPRFTTEFSPYLRRQEDYIDQLEKEGQLYREELSRVLDRIRDAADKPPSEEEESDREIKGRGRRGRGPSIVYSSRISELEAQLTQVRLELRKAQDEAAYLKAHSKPIQPPVSQQAIQQLESLQRERDDLNERVSSLQELVTQLRDKEASATQKVKRSLDVVDQAQYDKNQLEMEVRRLKSELDRMTDKQREALQESARRVSEAERRYAMQIERLNGDLAAQWDAANRLNLELDRARRTEAELRRELAQKANTIEELKKELLTKTGSLQNEALTASEEREKLESELSACRLSVERAERQGRQETARTQAEIQALRSRLDRADQDLLHSRKENIRLTDVIAGLEKELSLAKLTKDSAASKDSKRADELTSMIKDMDAKHEETKSELEALIQSQTQLMEKLNGECQTLTKRLEESSARHKEEMASLQNNLEYISSKLEAPDHYQNQDWRDNGKFGKYGERDVAEEKIPESTQKTIGQQNLKEEKVGSYNEEGGPTKNENQKEHIAEDIPEDGKNGSGYNPEEFATKQVSEIEKNEPYVSQDQQHKYDQPQDTYEADPTYKPEEYETQKYNTAQPEGYDQGQPYDQQPTGEYAQGSEYDQTGEYAGQEYGQGQEYSGEAYGQDQGYNQGDGTYQEQEYAQGQLYDQNNVPYDQNYDQTGGQYEYPQGEGYEGQVYTGTGEVYQPEEYTGTPGDQEYQEKGPEQEYTYQEKS